MRKTLGLCFGALASLFLAGCIPLVAGTVGTAVVVDNDRRSTGDFFDDKSLHVRMSTWLVNDPAFDNEHINLLIFQDSILATGEVANEEIRTYFNGEARARFPEIRKIHNRLTIESPTSLLERSKDSALTVRINLKLFGQEVVNPIHVKVATSKNVTYLLGALTEREASYVVNTVAEVKGVERIVKLFDYLASRPQEELDKEKAQQEREIRERRVEILETQRRELQEQINELERGN